MTERSASPRGPLFVLVSDPASVAAATGVLLVMAIAAVQPTGSTPTLTGAVSRAVFALASASACLLGVRRVTHADERWFWILLAGSLLGGLTAEILGLALPSGSATTFVTVGISILSYVPLMAGVDRFAGGRTPAGRSHLSRWTRPGLLTITAAGWLAYAALLPLLDPSGSKPPHWSAYTVLDLIVVGGFVGAGRADRSRRWYTLQRWLLGTFALALMVNAMAGSTLLQTLAVHVPAVEPLAWLTPHVAVILAARLRRLLPEDETPPDWPQGATARPTDTSDTTMLVLAAFSLPVAHMVGRLAGHLPIEGRTPQDFVVAGATLLLGGLAANEYRAREVARTVLARERWDVERSMLQMQKMEAIGRLGGGIAHDFNNLLTAIGGYADIVRDSLPPDDATADAMGRVLTSVDRATSLTQQLLAVGRRQRLRAEAVDVNEVVRDLPFAHRHLLSERVEFTPDLGADVRPAWVDPAQFEQVLVNLVVNARDAMPAGGTLRVTTRNVNLADGAPHGWPESRAGTFVRLEVADAGTGIPEDILPRVFEPFFTTKPQGSGTGLGLAIVYGIIRQSGGRIGLASVPGQGTTVIVDLPAAVTRTQAATSERATGVMGTETILVAEDEQAVRELVRSMLALGGYRVLPAGSGEEALNVARGHDGPIHLLLTDVVMPGINGRQLAERLVRERPSVRVLYMSGYTDDVSVRTGVLDGVVALLAKPFTRQALLDAVRQTIDGRPRQDDQTGATS